MTKTLNLAEGAPEQSTPWDLSTHSEPSGTSSPAPTFLIGDLLK
jgi:hypothetical protein